AGRRASSSEIAVRWCTLAVSVHSGPNSRIGRSVGANCRIATVGTDTSMGFVTRRGDLPNVKGVKAVVLNRGAEAEARIAGKAVAWHVMTRASRFGITDFVVCGEPVPPDAGAVEPDWHVTTLPGAGLKQAEPYIDDDLFVVADTGALADVDLHQLIECARGNRRLATVAAVRHDSEYV